MLERPLIYLVPAAAGALFCAVCLDFTIPLRGALLLLAVFLFLAGLFINYRRAFTIFSMLAAMCFSFSGFSAYNLLVVEPIRLLSGENMDVKATLLQDPVIYDDSQRALTAISVSGMRSFRAYCYLPLTESSLCAGDSISANIHFYIPGSSEGFDRANYQASNRCFIAASCNTNDEGKPIRFSVDNTERNSLRFLPQRIARYCKAAVSSILPERAAGLLNALLLGDKAGISDDDALAIRIAGLSHLIAVSGLHVGFLVAFCSILGRRLGTLISVPFILLFVPVAGATPSVIRAAVMYLVAAAAFLLRKEANGLNSLFFALALLLIVNPYAIASLSLQLSFAATLGLILFAGKMQRQLLRPFLSAPKIFRQIAAVIAGSLSCTICASVFTIPILFSSFGYVSVLSVISNLLVTGVTAVCFIGGVLLCLLSPVCFPLAVWCGKLIRPLLIYMLDVCHWISNLSFGMIHWSNGFGVAALVLFFAAILAALLAGNKVKWRYVLPTVCIILVGITAAGSYYDGQHYTVTYLPCGSGQAIVVADTAAREMTLIDCAGDGGYHNAAASVREWMQWNGFRKIDTLVLTAVDKGHARDLPELLDKTEIEKILIPAGCKKTKYNTELLELLSLAKAESITETIRLPFSAVITAFPICNGKLGVQIANQVLVLHSPTQKQLAAFESIQAYAAADLVISQRNTEDIDLLKALLTDTGAKRIILQTATADVPRQIDTIPVDSPYFTGEIQESYRKGE